MTKRKRKKPQDGHGWKDGKKVPIPWESVQRVPGLRAIVEKLLNALPPKERRKLLKNMRKALGASEPARKRRTR